MEHIQEKLDAIKHKLTLTQKEKLLCLSTTANIHNPDIYFGSMRETATTLAGNIIVRDVSELDHIIEMFDGFVDYFLIDPEIKNEVPNLESYSISRIQKSKYLVYKPNNFTVAALDMMIAHLFGTIRGKRIYIVGFGNIGSKAAVSLCERGAHIIAYERNTEKLKKQIEGLNFLKRSDSQIDAAINMVEGARDADIIIGCTPGVPVINPEMVCLMKPNGTIIDVGNGTITPEGIAQAHERNIEMLSLSSMGGYVGMVENWLYQRKVFQGERKKVVDNITLIIPGILGGYGDILVDSLEQPTKVIGVCNGRGDLIPSEEAKQYLRQLAETAQDVTFIQKLQSLYL